MADPGPFVADLRAESDDLDALVAHLPADRWADPTPAPGWTIAHQIGHLLWTDRVALTALGEVAAGKRGESSSDQIKIGVVGHAVPFPSGAGLAVSGNQTATLV